MVDNAIQPKAYWYIRMSTEGQMSGDSLRRQLPHSCVGPGRTGHGKAPGFPRASLRLRNQTA